MWIIGQMIEFESYGWKMSHYEYILRHFLISPREREKWREIINFATYN